MTASRTAVHTGGGFVPFCSPSWLAAKLLLWSGWGVGLDRSDRRPSENGLTHSSSERGRRMPNRLGWHGDVGTSSGVIPTFPSVPM